MAENEENEVYLSAKDIRDWKSQYEALVAERATLVTQAAQLHQRQGEVARGIHELGKKLNAAIPFSPGLSEWITEQEFNAIDEPVALTSAILRALASLPVNGRMNRGHLQQHVARHGYPAQKLQANQNYLYIALKRLADRKLIVEDNAGFSITDAGKAEVTVQRRKVV